MKILMCAVVFLMGAAIAEEPLYVLEYPGIAFDWLVPELTPPVEGVLSEEAGSLAEEVGELKEYENWLKERLEAVLPPDFQDNLLLGTVDWCEASMKSPNRDGASLGLATTLNFNLITETSSVAARGRAYAFFVNGYSVMLYGISPAGVTPTAGNVLDEIVAWAYLID